MSDAANLATIMEVNAASGFNRFAGFEVLHAADGRAEIGVKARPELLQYAGLLHAGALGALIDVSCGFAAATLAGRIVVVQYSVRCYRPASGERFIARAHVVKSGRRQLFVEAEIFALSETGEVLVAGGDAVLMPH